MATAPAVQNRTFQFYGLAYGSSPVSVTVVVDTVQIYSGPITTVDQPVNPQPTPQPSDQVVLYQLDNSALLNTAFSGSVPTTITVTGGSGVILGAIWCNYCSGDWSQGYGTSTVFGTAYWGDPANSENTPDARSSVFIDGVQQVPPLPTSLGEWNWFVPSGSTFTYNWNIGTGSVNPAG